jgi:hypothetical protein
MTTSDNTSESPGSTPRHAANMLLMASCDCLTKSPDAKFHDPSCRYRITAQLLESYDALELRCRSLAMIFPKILEALGNGSACVGEGNSIEFLQDIPNEVRLVVQGYQRRCRSLEAALKGMLDRYVGLANSGDAGYWDCEQEDEVIAAREALAQGSGGGETASNLPPPIPPREVLRRIRENEKGGEL